MVGLIFDQKVELFFLSCLFLVTDFKVLGLKQSSDFMFGRDLRCAVL